MLKPRNPIITTLISLIAASACHRLPLSIGEGIDDAWNNPDGTGSAGTGVAAPGGAPDIGECEGEYSSCLASGEESTLCRALLERCAGGGTAGTGSGGAPSLDECNATYVLCLESGESPEICRGELSRCEPGAGGAAGAPGEGGAPGYAGSPNAD
jgi:hypothetical protein